MQHTHAWQALHGRLQRLVQCLQSSSTPHEREALKNHFATHLVEQAKQYSEGAAESAVVPATSGWRATIELNSLALLAVANNFDRLITPRQQIAPQVRALVGGLFSAEKVDDALSSAWSLFMQQASFTLGGLGSGRAAVAAVTAAAASGPPSPAMSPASPLRRAVIGSESPEPPSAVRGELGEKALPRNGSGIFPFEV